MLFGVGMRTWAAKSDVVASVTCAATSSNEVTFTITRNETSAATFVNYRTYDGSAVGGVHFQHQAGRLYFEKGQASKDVVVKLLTPTEIFTYGNVDREFGLVAWNSFSENIEAKYAIKNSRSITSIDNSEKSYYLDDWFRWNDMQDVNHYLSFYSFMSYNEHLYCTYTKQNWRCDFYIKYHVYRYDHGYFNVWMYENESEIYYYRYDDVSDGDHREPSSGTKNVSALSQLHLKWRSDGKSRDDADVTNLYVYGKISDNVKPTAKNLYCNTSYAYATGDLLTVAIAYDEIVNFTNTLADYTIETNVGTMSYVGGAGTNVLYFQKVLDADYDAKELAVNSCNFTLKDLSGNTQNAISIKNSSFRYKSFRTDVLNVETDIWKKQASLSWSNKNTKDVDGLWYIYRYKTDLGPEEDEDYAFPLLRNDITNITGEYLDNDENLLYDTDYTYLLQFVPKSWTVKELMLDRFIPQQTILKRDFNIQLSRTNYDDHIELDWKSSDFQDTKTHEFKIFRRLGKEGIYSEIAKTNSTTTHYVDDDVASGCATYYYKISTSSLFADNNFPAGVEYFSDSLTGKLTSESQVLSLEASKGTYANTVKLTWNAKQTGVDATNYKVYRRDINAEEGWVKLYTTSGTASVYSFDDNTALSGKYYEYKVASSYICAETGLDTDPVEVTDDGFCRALGVVSGRVTYGTGTAVSGVKVSVVKSSEDEVLSQFYALQVNGAGSGIQLPLSMEDGAKYFENPWTIQMYVNPDNSITNASGESVKYAPLVEVSNTFGLSLKKVSDEKTYSLCLTGMVSDSAVISKTSLKISSNTYSHVTLSYNGKGTMSVRVTDAAGEIKKASKKFDAIKFAAENDTVSSNSLMFGSSLSGTNVFQGYLDEIRLFTDKELTDKEILKYYNHTLSGTEPNLMVYWPMDEGIKKQKTVYDYSKTSGVTNNNHGTILPGSSVTSENVPTDVQLSVSAISDDMGNYSINGIPFSGDGTAYMVVPAYGIHKFSPLYANRFISSSSLVHSGVDFEDVSSFKVTGTVYYTNTDYPVEGANLYVDELMCSKNGEPITTDVNGNFEISVPIGEHHIQVAMNGHTFEYDGRYPSNPLLEHEFKKEESNLLFFDNTLVPIAGRVVGGSVEKSKELGFGLSKNNIGQAIIDLYVAGHRMNVHVCENGIINDTTVQLIAPSASDSIHSTAYFDAGNKESHHLYVTTDSLTGEWSAMVPPVAYQVNSIKMMSDKKATVAQDALKNMSFSNLDLTDVLTTYTDSIVGEDGVVSKFTYNGSLVVSYNAEPSFIVKDRDALMGAFGDKKAIYRSVVGNDTLAAYTDNGGKIEYAFDYPLFEKDNTYRFDIEAFEEYFNYDGEDVLVDTVPLSGVIVTITNEMSSSQKVYVESGITEDSVSVSAGDFVELEDNQLQLDSLGKACYTWAAGFPNITAPYTRNLSISYEHNEKVYNWKYAGSKDGVFRGIVIGSLPTGNNFVTAGPTEIQFILRDPAGTGSYAYWEEGTTVVTGHSVDVGFHSETEAISTTYLGAETSTIEGTPGFGVISNLEAKHELTVGVKVEAGYTKSRSWTTTTTTTKRISTSGEFDYVGAQGDVFVGSATNIVFGNARSVELTKDTLDNYAFDLKDITTANMRYGTSFSYTQNYIENTLLPNLELNRNALLTTVNQAVLDSFVNTTKDVIYLTTLSSDDERFGASNSDKAVWGDLAVDEDKVQGPSYKMFVPVNSTEKHQDMVAWYNEQMRIWKNKMSQNEEMKIKAKNDSKNYFDKNYSFDAGATVESSSSICEDTLTVHNWEENFHVLLGFNWGVKIHGTGVTFELNEDFQQIASGSSTDGNTACVETGFALVEDGDDDAISVDVYKAPDGFGAIFITRGGQTSCPYEGEVKTKYYKPGELVISDATMQIEVPKISAENFTAVDVPAGGNATYTLLLTNESETKEDVWFYIGQVDGTNPDGAILQMDGMSMTSQSRSVLVPAGETVKKTLVLKQSNDDVLNYKNIGIALYSQCQNDETAVHAVIADTVYLSAQFVPSCSNVTLEVAERVLNSDEGAVLNTVIKDYDPSFKSLKALRVLYKYSGDVKWTLAHEYVLDSANLTKNNEMLPDGGRVYYALDMSNSSLFPDGTYQVKVETSCDFGNGEVNNESEIIEFVKDMARPQILGNPNPSDGIFDAGDEISVTFNEDIRGGYLTQANNFIVQAVLNDDEVDHNVAMKMNNASTYAATTESNIVLANKSFSVDMWVNLSSGGTLLNHKSDKENFTITVGKTGKLTVDVNGKKVTSTKAIPFDKWCFLTLCYTAGEDSSIVNALVAYEATQITLLADKFVPNYGASGKLRLGSQITGAIGEVALWGTNRSNAESQSQMHFMKAASTENLIGYWKFNEGHGKVAKDLARNRHFALSADSWYLNNENFAAKMDGTNHLSLDITRCSALTSDDYMMEMWFAGAAQKNATLWSANTKVALKFNADGYLTLLTDGVERQLSTTNYLDKAWHHVALNVLRNGMTSVYVDGVLVKQLSSALVPALQASELTIGAQRYSESQSVYQYKDYFKGSVDEVRYWLATFNAKAIDQFRYNRMEGDEPGLKAYYPFEGKSYDAGQIVYEFSLDDMSSEKIGAAKGNAVSASTSPALKPKPEMTNLNYSFVASERTIVISLNESASRLEGTTVNFTVRNVLDEKNNISLPVSWSAFINQNRLLWVDDAISIEKGNEEEATFEVAITNQGASTESWVISNLPSWLTASKTSGSLSAQKTESIAFVVTDATPVGTYEETIYLTGNDGISVPFTVNMKVNIGKPNWKVDPSMYENSMSVIAQLKISDKFSTDQEDMVAAFVDGECVGVASPVYYPRYDAYLVSLDVYANSKSNGKSVTFKAWDASTGVIYPSLTSSSKVTFTTNKLYGSVENPLLLESNSLQEQSLDLHHGWNWISLNVKPSDKSVNSVFGDVASESDILKSKSAFAASDGINFSGSLSNASVGSMYKIKMNEEANLTVAGNAVDASKEPVTIKSGWNWIGYNSIVNMSLEDAFAGLTPTDGDMVKGQTGFALYQGYEWVGTLSALTPGKGYMYKSVSPQNRSFTYPSKTTSLRSLVSKKPSKKTDYVPVSESTYPGNMTIVAMVQDVEDVLDSVQVGIFDKKGVCRAAAATMDKLAFLTIPGDNAGDSLLIKVLFNGDEYVLNQGLTYVEDAVMGSLNAPYIIQLTPVNGLSEVMNSTVSIYPTLVENSINVACEAVKVLNYSINDVTGRLIVTAEVNGSDFNIDASFLTQGTYVLQLETADGPIVKRFTKK